VEGSDIEMFEEISHYLIHTEGLRNKAVAKGNWSEDWDSNPIPPKCEAEELSFGRHVR
jgi:hypothetical protein